MKKTYYCVTSAYYDDGRVTAAVVMSMDAEEKPQNKFTSTRDRDIYSEWYESLDEANKAVAEARAESTPRR